MKLFFGDDCLKVIIIMNVNNDLDNEYQKYEYGIYLFFFQLIDEFDIVVIEEVVDIFIFLYYDLNICINFVSNF